MLDISLWQTIKRTPFLFHILYNGFKTIMKKQTILNTEFSRIFWFNKKQNDDLIAQELVKIWNFGFVFRENMCWQLSGIWRHWNYTKYFMKSLELQCKNFRSELTPLHSVAPHTMTKRKIRRNQPNLPHLAVKHKSASHPPHSIA